MAEEATKYPFTTADSIRSLLYSIPGLGKSQVKFIVTGDTGIYTIESALIDGNEVLFNLVPWEGGE